MKNVEIVFIPVPGSGHLVSTLQFAKNLIDRNNTISITILSIPSPFPSSLSSYTNSLVASEPRIRLIDVPQPPAKPPSIESFKSPAKRFSLYIETHLPNIRNIITEIVSSHAKSDSVRVAGIVVDFFCASMIDVAKELHLPSYLFMTSNTGYLSFMLHLPAYHEQNGEVPKDSDPEWLIKGIEIPVPPRVLPVALTDGSYSAYVKLASRFRETKGIIVNTFLELETHAINSFSDDDQTPPLYPVGPVIDVDDGQAHSNLEQAQRDRIIKWLDDQPQSSVVFLCFGSMGSFEAEQVKEIAAGLEHSGQRFLWALRMPPPKDKGMMPSDCSNPEEVLPDGFLERTQGKGLICGWAPQVEVLGHEAIGGFVSHCGWNSILESLWHGVPIVTWPMYAEQQLNAFRMVKESGLAMEMRLDYKKGSGEVVGADEIERAVVAVMDMDSEVRKKVKEMGEMTRKAVKDGGSSFASVGRFIEDVIGNNCGPN
ncbi:PREDICTED: UDP-glycosyltransferase [Prunus dulcis]|uniref:Glycosyltransferase n=1 Tax=Prunus dulcis TaxID=3755 RepID=A0A5E4FXB2_PRUDU|nr:UDP-glycosyltransferase 71K1-like [Prunus dulcis]VVA32117.1 PREDICTED: UDP-glycosyltransferase [Prunus dulcis]